MARVQITLGSIGWTRRTRHWTLLGQRSGAPQVSWCGAARLTPRPRKNVRRDALPLTRFSRLCCRPSRQRPAPAPWQSALVMAAVPRCQRLLVSATQDGVVPAAATQDGSHAVGLVASSAVATRVLRAASPPRHQRLVALAHRMHSPGSPLCSTACGSTRTTTRWATPARC